MKRLPEMKDLARLGNLFPGCLIFAGFPVEGCFQRVFYCQGPSLNKEEVLELLGQGEIGKCLCEICQFTSVRI